MTTDQIALISLLIILFGTLATDRFRIEVVALTGLAAAFLMGLIPAASVFSGFAHPAVITVAEILILVGALQASRLVQRLAESLTRRFTSERLLLLALCLIGGATSVFMNNIGALALMIPLATAISQQAGIPVGRLLMPLSFAILLAGTCSLLGTPANMIVSDALAEATGRGFALFDFTPIGLPVFLAGLAAIILFMPALLPRASEPSMPRTDTSSSGTMILEATLPASSPFTGQYLTDIKASHQLRAASIRRGEAFVFARREAIRLEAGDSLLLEGSEDALRKLLKSGALTGNTLQNGDEVQRSAVVVPESVILGSRISTLEALRDAGVRILAITSARKRLEGSFSDLQIAIGDVLHLAGPADAVDLIIHDYGLISLDADREEIPLRKGLPALFAFLFAIALTAFDILRPELAFGAAIAGLALFRQIDITAAIRRLNWPILLILAAMIPIGTAVERTGMAELVAHSFLNIAPHAGPVFILFSILITAVLITPFVNNATTAIVLAPIALEIAASAAIPPQAALLAVAIGVSLDFVTPFGHHNNMIVMGISGYRFRDFPIAGFPVLLASFIAALAALSMMIH